jgi:hemolysin III
MKRITLGRMQNPVRGFLHGTAALLSVVGGVFLWFHSPADLPRQIALLIYTLSLVALFTVSSLYHSFPWRRRWKERMQRLDHSMIYFLIAGSSTPVAFIVLDGWWRWVTLGAVWGIALIGILQKVFMPKVGDWLSMSMQATQGWILLPLMLPMAHRLPLPALLLGLLGGVLYTVGMLSLITRRPGLWPRVFSHHEVFHVFVVAGSATHYAMTFWYVARFPGV